MAKRALILLGGHRGNGLLYAQAAKRLGLHPITLSANPSHYDYLTAGESEAIQVDTDKLDALIQECSRLRARYEIVGITGFAGDDESLYATVGKLCRHFDLPGPNPESVERCCDKFEQRQSLAKAGIPMPAYRLAANASEVERSAEEIGLPVILKPTAGNGSSGVRLCRNADEMAEHTKYLLDGKHIWPSSSKILVEEFAQGPFYCAEIMGNEIIGIDAADWGDPPHFVCRAATFPAVLSNEEHERIEEISLNCLQALGLGWGPTNIEFRWTKRGPVVIEVNPRLPGAPNPQLVQLAYGIDLIAEHIKLVIGRKWNLRRSHSYAAAARYLVPDRDGVLHWSVGDAWATAASGVAEVKFYAESQTPIVRKGDYRDYIAHIVAASPSLAETEAILQQAVASISWSITPFPALEQEQSAGPQLLNQLG